MSITTIDEARDQLLSIADNDLAKAELLVEYLQQQRRQKSFIRYYEPHPEQQKFWDQLTPEQDTWMILGGNGSGKSSLAEWIVAVWLVGKEYFRGEKNWKWVERLPVPEGPVSVRGVGLTSAELRDPMLEKLMGSSEHPPFIPPELVKNYNRQECTILLTNGSKFHGKSADVDPKTHGGPSLDLVHIDEECKYEIFKENQRRIRKRGGKMLVSATPLDDVSNTSHPWIFDLIEQWRGGDPTLGIIFMALEKNIHLDPEFIRREKTRLSGLPDADARLYGIPVRRSGLYYPMWRAEAPLWVPAHDLPEDVMRVVMVDPAVTGPVGALWGAIDRKGKIYLYRCYKDKGPTVSAHVEAILAENRGDPIHMWLMDPFKGRQSVESTQNEHLKVIDVWRKCGLPRLRLAEVDYEKALVKSREYMQAAWDPTSPHPPVEIFDHLEPLRLELDRYIVDSIRQGANRGEAIDRPRKGNSDLIECMQYMMGMNLRARAPQSLKQPVGSTSYFGSTQSVHPAKFAPKGFSEEPW